jgi:hypothetical protein
MRAREDPTSMRFDRQDPFAAALTQPYVKAYVYATGDPALLTDPLGLWPDNPFSGVTSAVSSAVSSATSDVEGAVHTSADYIGQTPPTSPPPGSNTNSTPANTWPRIPKPSA